MSLFQVFNPFRNHIFRLLRREVLSLSGFCTQAPDTVPGDATTITLTSNPQYQVTDAMSSAATLTGFRSVSDSDIGRVVDILGSGGTYPSTITDANDFLLEGGVTWTTNAGSRISFKIKKTGTSAYTYIEVPGSRVQTA